MKRLFLTIVISLTLFGCGNQEEVDQNTQVETPIEEKNDSDGVFTKEDQNIAENKAKKFIVLLTEFHGRTVKTSEDYKSIQEEMNKKENMLDLFHDNVHFVKVTSIDQNENNNLMLSTDRFVLGEKGSVKYYQYIDAHELIIPLTYKSGNDKELQSSIRFVKNLDGEIQISSASLVGGLDLEKDDEEAYYDEYERKELQEEVKNDLKIQ